MGHKLPVDDGHSHDEESAQPPTSIPGAAATGGHETRTKPLLQSRTFSEIFDDADSRTRPSSSAELWKECVRPPKLMPEAT